MPRKIDRREARIIIPVCRSDGSLPSPRLYRDYLRVRFGGYTMTEGYGADPHVQDAVEDGGQKRELVHVYDVAVNAADSADWRDLRAFAEHVARDFAQVGVYVRWPDVLGHVSFVGDPDDADTIPYRAREPEDDPRYDESRDQSDHHSRGDSSFYGWNRRETDQETDAAQRRKHSERVRARAEANRPWE